MDIQFQGLSPLFSAPLLVLLMLAVIIFSWWSYAYLKSIPPLKRSSLIALRSSALIILLFLLLNPYLQINESETHLPRIAIYFDDSQSMSVIRGDYQGEETYRSIIEQMDLQSFDGVEIDLFRFDGMVDQIDHPDDLQLGGGVTNIDEVMRHIRDQSDRSVAAVLFSDGIVTRGRDPVFNARELSIPLFTIPVGDTTESRDIAISDILTNETGYVNSIQPVEVTVTQQGFEGESTTLQLLKDDEVIHSEQITFDSDQTLDRVTFNLEFEEEGLHNFEAVVPEMEGEVTAENNRYPFSVNVIDEKTNIYHLAYEIHPDVKTVRSILQSDQNVELYPYTWTGNRFIEDVFEADSDDIDLLVIHGRIDENSGLTQEMLDQLPVIHFYTSGMSIGDIEESVIPVTADGAGNIRNIHLHMNENIGSHPILEIISIEFNRQPPLVHLQADYSLPTTVQPLLLATYTGTESDVPVLMIEESGNVRRSLVNAHGWYRYYQSNQNPTRDFTVQLFSNLASWVSSSPDRDHLTVSPGRRIYQEGEEVSFRGDLLNEAGEPETDAVIAITLTDQDGQERSYSMNHRSRGNYFLSSRNLASGNYTYEAEARKDGRIIDSTGGEFSVSASTLEFINTKRDDERLQQLAEVTDGLFLNEYNRDRLFGELENRDLLEPVHEQRVSFRFLYEHIAWFILAMLLLSAEWMLRRQHSLP